MTILGENMGATSKGDSLRYLEEIAAAINVLLVNDWRSPFEFRDRIFSDDGLAIALSHPQLSQFLN